MSESMAGAKARCDPRAGVRVKVPGLSTPYSNEDCRRRGKWVWTTCPESLRSYIRPDRGSNQWVWPLCLKSDALLLRHHANPCRGEVRPCGFRAVRAVTRTDTHVLIATLGNSVRARWKSSTKQIVPFKYRYTNGWRTGKWNEWNSSVDDETHSSCVWPVSQANVIHQWTMLNNSVILRTQPSTSPVLAERLQVDGKNFSVLCPWLD